MAFTFMIHDHTVCALCYVQLKKVIHFFMYTVHKKSTESWTMKIMIMTGILFLFFQFAPLYSRCGYSMQEDWKTSASQFLYNHVYK